MRTLLIDGNSGDARLVREELGASEGPFAVRLTWVDRLDKGLAHIAGETVDAVLLDLSLPDSAGLETLARVLEAAPAVPVIVPGVQSQSGTHAVAFPGVTPLQHASAHGAGPIPGPSVLTQY